MKLFLCEGDIENAEKKRMDGAASMKFDGITHGLESASLLFLGFFLIGLSGFAKRIKK
jgi:hypothetical protein